MSEAMKACIEDEPLIGPEEMDLRLRLHTPYPEVDRQPACSSIACASCPKPGKCCQTLFLSVGTPDDMVTALEFLAFMATVQQQGDTYGAPFMPMFKHSKDGRWAAWCPNLGRDGRCTDYANRPYTCRVYKPATDKGCVLYRPAPACAKIWLGADAEPRALAA